MPLLVFRHARLFNVMAAEGTAKIWFRFDQSHRSVVVVYVLVPVVSIHKHVQLRPSHDRSDFRRIIGPAVAPPAAETCEHESSSVSGFPRAQPSLTVSTE